MSSGVSSPDVAQEIWDARAARRCGVTDGPPTGLVVQDGRNRRVDLSARKNFSQRNPPAPLLRNEVCAAERPAALDLIESTHTHRRESSCNHVSHLGWSSLALASR